jgi:hypothetical protein
VETREGPTTGDETEGEGTPPCAPAIVADVLRQLDKTVRLHQLYPSTNPTYIKTLATLREMMMGLWQQAGSVTLAVTETQFQWYGTAVLDEPEKASDSLPWTLFKDGVRQVTLSPGFEGEELDALLDIIPRVRRAQDFENDVLTLLWEQDFEHLSYRFIDTVTSEGAPLDPSATPGRWPASATVRESPKSAVEAARQRAQAAAAESLEAALRAPAAAAAVADARAAAMAYLDEAVAAEYDANLRCDVCDALLDVLELQRDPVVREEVVRHLESVMLFVLAGKDFATIAHVLHESSLAVERGPAMPESVRNAVQHLGDKVSDPALLGPLLEALDTARDRPAPDEVGSFLDRLGGRALGVLLWWSSESRHLDLRALYAACAYRLAVAHPAELGRLVNAEQSEVALEAMRQCAVLELEAAVPALVRQLGHADEPRRAGALGALVAIGTHSAMAGVERALGDASIHVRTTAMKALTTAAYKGAFKRVEEWVKGRDVRDMDPNERRALFELYGTLCGEAGVEWLSSQLVGPTGFFKRKSDPETRACAAAALGRVGTPSARETLMAARTIDDPLIRRAVTRALTRGSES